MTNALTDAELQTLKRTGAILRSLGIATVDWDEEDGVWTVWNVARMGTRAHTLERAVEKFEESGFGDPA